MFRNLHHQQTRQRHRQALGHQTPTNHIATAFFILTDARRPILRARLHGRPSEADRWHVRPPRRVIFFAEHVYARAGRRAARRLVFHHATIAPDGC